MKCSENKNWQLSKLKSLETQQINKKKNIEDYNSDPKKCLCCNKPIEYKFKSVKKFCNSSCAAKYNNLHREIRSEVKKTKVVKCKRCNEEVVVNVHASIENCLCSKCREDYKIKKKVIVRKRKQLYCKFCSKEIVYPKQICDKCRTELYSVYAPSCRFNFSLSLFPEEFDFSLLKQYGMYKAKNRGDNLKGVSRDHLFSIHDGFKEKISYQILSHPANCRLVLHTDNQHKNRKSIITLEELLKRIRRFEDKYNFNNDILNYVRVLESGFREQSAKL